MECQICYEQFDSKSFVPKILVKCGHSFCKICIERISNKKTIIQCPICRENTKIGKKEILPTNYSLCELIDFKNSDLDTRSILEKYKFFEEKNYKNVLPQITRNFEPKKLALKKIVNNDFIYVEEFEIGQNYSLFNNMSKRNRRYCFNRNSHFANLFNEYSYNISMYRKASWCKHSHSCLEYIMKKVFYSLCLGILSKYPIRIMLNFICKKFNLNTDDDFTNKIIFGGQWAVASFVGFKNIIKCLLGFYLDEFLKYKQ